MKRRLHLALLLGAFSWALFGALSCGDDDPARPEPFQPPDIRFVTLTPDTPLVDTVYVAVRAERAELVSLSVDGTEAVADTSFPFLLAWDSKSVTDGEHEFLVRARNDSGTDDTTFTRVVKNLEDPVLVITKTPSRVYLGQTYQLVAKVLNRPTWTVVWNVVEGPTCGTVDATGLYQAPMTRPDPPTVTFRAQVSEDPLLTAAKTADFADPIEVSITSYPTQVAVGQTFQLTAQVTNHPEQGVAWSIDEGDAHGVIDQTGLYTAPLAPPDPPVVTFRATSLFDTLTSATAQANIVGNVSLTVTPDQFWLYPKESFDFGVTVDGADASCIRWSTIGGYEFGGVYGPGRYYAPSEIPHPPWALIQAWCDVDPSARDTVRVDLLTLPPDMALQKEIFHAGFVATSLAEQVTGIAATALGMARFLGEDDLIRSGRLTEDEEGWSHQFRPGTDLEIVPRVGPVTRINYTVADGSCPANYGYLSYHRGVTFKGELDCTIQVGVEGPRLRLTNSSRSRHEFAKPACPCDIEAAYVRTLSGSIPGADGGEWSFDLELIGEMWNCGDSSMRIFAGVDQSLSGVFTTPDGLSVAVEDSFSISTVADFYGRVLSRDSGFEGGFTAEIAGNAYAWTGLSIYTSYNESGPRDLANWRSMGSVLENGLDFGAAGFDWELTPEMKTVSRPWMDYGPYRVVYLDRFPFQLDHPSGPAASPF